MEIKDLQGFAAHRLRAGFCTAAAEKGAQERATPPRPAPQYDHPAGATSAMATCCRTRWQAALTGNTSKADSQYVKDAFSIEDEYESELAAVQVALERFEVAPHEYAERRAEIAARAYLRLAEAHQRFIGRNN